MLSLILFTIIGIELDMMHGLYLAVIIIYLIATIISLILRIVSFALKQKN